MKELFELGEELLALLEEPNLDWSALNQSLSKRNRLLAHLPVDELSISQSQVLLSQDERLLQTCRQRVEQVGLRLKWCPSGEIRAARFIDRLG